MTKDEIYKMAQKANLPACHITHPKALERFAILVAKQQICRAVQWFSHQVI